MAVEIGGVLTGGVKPPPGSATDQIRQNLPEVDTNIDPTEFASTDATTADVSLIDPPEDIDAANIGDYTPYDAVTSDVRPEATVEGRLSGLLSQNSDYMQRARSEAEQFANRRGLLNSSMAVGAAQGAAIDRALPIAQQDAAALLEQDFRNQGYSNEAARYLAEQSVQRENLQAGLNQDTNQFNAAQNFEAQRLNQAAQNQANQQAAAETNRNNFAVLNADLQGQLAGIDNQLAQNLEQLTREYSILENLDSINGSIYQQLVAEIGTILANEKKVSTAQSKINNLLASAGVEFAFSTGQPIGGAGGGPSPVTVTPPPAPTRSNSSQSQNQSCFTGDTLIIMDNGSMKQIADIKVGDVVLGVGSAANIVTGIETPVVGARMVYSFNKGKPFVTSEHPFMTSKGWKSIDPLATAAESHGVSCSNLRTGDYLEQLADPLVRLEKIQEHYFDPETRVYNLLLNGNNTYYADGFLAHNKRGGLMLIRDATFKDLEFLMPMAHQAHGNSVFAEFEMNEAIVQKNFVTAMQFDDGFAKVVEVNGKVVGGMVGIIFENHYGIRCAVDLFTHSKGGTDKLVKLFSIWAKVRAARFIQITDISKRACISKGTRFQKLIAKLGFKPGGNSFIEVA